MAKTYIVINLNKEESAESRLERSRDRTRWGIFSVLIFIFLAANARVLMINSGYNDIIRQKKAEISRLKQEIEQLQSRGKNLSKDDILSFADLEHDRFLWAKNLEILGKMTPDVASSKENTIGTQEFTKRIMECLPSSPTSCSAMPQ